MNHKIIVYRAFRTDKRQVKAKHKYLNFFTVAVVNCIMFMNCSGFKTAGGLDLSSLSSATCRAKLQALAEISVQSSQCDNAENYSCERRMFSPALENGDSIGDHCGNLESQSVCVTTRTLAFNTEAARATEAESAFAPGGEFNRTDFQCSHNLNSGDAPLFQAQGTSVLDALANAISLCRKKAAQ